MGGSEKRQFPEQSEDGKCELRLNSDDKLYCEQLDGCKGECHLCSLPNDDPDAEPRIERQPATPSKDRYYFCQCR